MVRPFLTPGLVLSALCLAGTAAGQTTTPNRNVGFRFTAASRTQIAIWLEDASGKFLKTVRLSQAVAYRGIGNRPGAAQMNSGFRWPYGRREGVLPVWAHRRAAAPGAKPFKRVIFQNRGSEGFASRTSDDSSAESYFCLSFSMEPTAELRRKAALDAVTCASRFMSDKGRYLAPGETAYAEPAEVGGQGMMRVLGPESLYPPRRDLGPCTDASAACAVDTGDILRYDQDVHAAMPDIDAVSMATPPADVEQQLVFSIPADWPNGEYVAWVEVNTEGQYNGTYNDQTLRTPETPAGAWDIWAINSGYAYRGQPSVVYRVPFELGTTNVYSVIDPAYYGDVDGFGPTGGDVHPLDASITNDVVTAPGQGADRLRLMPSRDYRLQVFLTDATMCGPHDPPGRPADVAAAPVAESRHSHQWGRLHFRAVDSELPLLQYEVRYSTQPIVDGDLRSFEMAKPAVAASIDSEGLTVPVTPKAGSSIEVDFGGMMPLTQYYVAVRAVDSCNTPSAFSVTTLTTTKQNFTKLSGCFVATAAYGSALEPEVQSLRDVRDALRPRNAVLAAATDLYYRAGPAAAAAIARSDSARAVVRSLLGPVVEVASAMGPLLGTRDDRAAGAPPVAPSLVGGKPSRAPATR